MSAELISALFGLVGSLLLAVPYFSDYRIKRKRERDIKSLNDGVFSAKDVAALRPRVKEIGIESVLEADSGMALCALIGCVLLVISFLLLAFAKHSGG
jgi:uncharacterized membrane protein